MSVSVQLDAEVEQRLSQVAARSGETIETVANRVLADSLTAHVEQGGSSVLPAFPLGVEQNWPGLSASKILALIDEQEYEDALERTRHERPAVRP